MAVAKMVPYIDNHEAPSKEVPNLKSLYRIHDIAKLAKDLHTTCSDNLQHIF